MLLFSPFFDVGDVVYAALQLFLLLFQFFCCPLCDALAVLFVVLILVLLSFCDAVAVFCCFNFGVVVCST